MWKSGNSDALLHVQAMKFGHVMPEPGFLVARYNRGMMGR